MIFHLLGTNGFLSMVKNERLTAALLHLTFTLYFSSKILYSSQTSLVYFDGTRLPLLVIGSTKAQLIINYYNF